MLLFYRTYVEKPEKNRRKTGKKPEKVPENGEK